MTPGHVTVVERRDPVAVERLLRGLPDWFGVEPAIVGYVQDAGSTAKRSYLAVDAATDDVVGALLVSRHFPESAEMHLLAVDPAHHRQGVGSRLARRFEDDMRSDGVRLLQVKTLGPSHPDRYYAQTIAFYRALGYLPLEEMRDFWDDEPCLILVKPLPPDAGPPPQTGPGRSSG
jgi:ribosomal protein S18 acetylase RimI-like enzyme